MRRLIKRDMIRIKEVSVKNNVDTLIFRIAICFGAKANSFYGNEKSPVRISHCLFATSRSEMRLVCISKNYGMNFQNLTR